MAKIISRGFGKPRAAAKGETRGTYIYTWGAGYHGQLGSKFVRGKKKYATVPRNIEIDVPVRQIACGGLHTAAVTDNGQVYTWGDARGNQLGYQPHGFTNQSTPFLVESLQLQFVVQVALGQSHSLALTDRGQIFSWGMSKFGQCGHGERQTVKTPKVIASFSPVGAVRCIDIACGDRHSVALAADGRTYSWGCGEHGQLGHGDDNDKLKPSLLTALQNTNVTSVKCGSIHSCFVSEPGELYICGFGEHFYAAENQNFFNTPVRIPFKERVVQVACGQSHNLALSDQGDVWAWGTGLYGQIGHGVEGSLHAPRLVLAGKHIAQVACGRYHSIALTTFGVLYSWGCGENGQLGQHTDENVLFPKVIEPNIGTVVGQISCGEHHTAVLTSTPYAHVDTEVADWLYAEKQEFEFKKKYLKRTNHGLVKQDLLKIQETMVTLIATWKEEQAAIKQEVEEEEYRGVASVNTRQTVEEELREYEESTDITEGHSLETLHTIAPTFLLHHQHGHTSQGDIGRPPSPRKAKQGGKLKKAQTARPASASPERGVVSVPEVAPVPPSGSMTERRPPADQGGTSRAAFIKESSQMVARMKNIIMDTGDSSNENRLKKMLALVFDFRKEYDSLKHSVARKMRLLTDNKQESGALRNANESIKDRTGYFEGRLKALEMKLNTVTIKITETEENRKNYALNISHLKEEELERFYQLEALRRQMSENDGFSKKMNELKLQSLEDKDRSETELGAFSGEIAAFQEFIQDQLGKFHNVSTVAKARREHREQEKELRTLKVRERITFRITKLSGELDDTDQEAAAMAQQLESVNERLRYFEKRFQQIASATGLTNPDSIINKFALKEEIKSELGQEIAVKKDTITRLQGEDLALTTQMGEAKAGFVDSRWKDVRQLQHSMEVTEAQRRKARAEAERLEQEVARFTEGLLHLATDLPPEFGISHRLARGSSPSSPSGAKGEGGEMVKADGSQAGSLLLQLEDSLGRMANTVTQQVEEREAAKGALRRAKEHEEASNAFVSITRAMASGGGMP
jgi:alpha-tubulin suppressor-like RCC1 family protein